MKLMTPITLIIIASVIALGAFFVTKNSINNQPVVPAQNVEVPQTPQLETVQVSLNLNPEFTTLSVGNAVSFAVNINTYDLSTSGVQSEFTYDPNVLEIETIEPGPFLIQPAVLIKSIDPKSGKISYALGSLQYSSGSGTLFTIHAKAIGQTAPLKNPLSFVKANTKVGLAARTKDKRYSEAETAIIFSEGTVSISP